MQEVTLTMAWKSSVVYEQSVPEWTKKFEICGTFRNVISMYLQGISKYTANNSYLSGTNPMIDFDFSAVVPPPTNQNLHHALYKVKNYNVGSR